MLKKLTLIVVIMLSFSAIKALSDFAPDIDSNYPFYFDAIVFASDKDKDGRLDVFVLIPNESLSFLKSGDNYVAKYSVNISISDSLENKVEDKTINGSASEKNYFDAQGGSAKFDYSQSVFYLKEGKYKVKVILTDDISKKEMSRSRTITVLNFKEFPFSISGIMFVSSIEAKDGRYIITPHVTDNVGNLSEGYFAFFEVYNHSKIDSADFVYEYLDKDGKILFQSEKIRKKLDTVRSQQFLKIKKQSQLPSGSYILQILTLKKSDTLEVDKSELLAMAQRSVKIYQSLAGNVVKDLDKAIKQLRYIATQDEIDYIETATTTSEKQKRFEEYWKKQDPTPNTDRNEAFEEYYERLNYADRSFKSYNDGWLTDKGNVYVVFGKPDNAERYAGYADNRIYEKWTYLSNREFLFVDNTGFGDFRLIRPMTVLEKYKYKR
jgi:GWxTD domain-containing protein